MVFGSALRGKLAGTPAHGKRARGLRCRWASRTNSPSRSCLGAALRLRRDVSAPWCRMMVRWHPVCPSSRPAAVSQRRLKRRSTIPDGRRRHHLVEMHESAGCRPRSGGRRTNRSRRPSSRSCRQGIYRLVSELRGTTSSTAQAVNGNEPPCCPARSPATAPPRYNFSSPWLPSFSGRPFPVTVRATSPAEGRGGPRERSTAV